MTIAVPAYRYQAGVARILSSLPLGDPRIEVIIGDDTPDGSLEAWFRGPAASRFAPHLAYHRNIPSLGAVPNWNDLIGRAAGRYIWLLHHDECPVDAKAVKKLLALLCEIPVLDAVLLDCVQVLRASGINRRHMPNWMRALVVKKMPQFLMRRNVIGSPSAIVLHREIYEKYDESLVWLVDVELFIRVLAKAKRVFIANDVTLLSFPLKLSITASIRSDIRRIKRRELAAIAKAGCMSPRWMMMTTMIVPLEAVLWKLLRVALRFPSWLGVSSLPRKTARDAWWRGLNGQSD